MVQELSPREREYVRLAGEWLTDKEIAARVGVSPRTVSNTLARAMRKLGVSSRRDAARLLVSSDYPGHSIPLADDGRHPLHQPPKGGPDENRGRTAAIGEERALGERMMRTLGFDFDRGRLDVSLHPSARTRSRLRRSGW